MSALDDQAEVAKPSVNTSPRAGSMNRRPKNPTRDVAVPQRNTRVRFSLENAQMIRIALYAQHALHNAGVLTSNPDDIVLASAGAADGVTVRLLKIASPNGGCFRTVARDQNGAGVYIGRRMSSRRDAELDFNVACERFNAHPGCKETSDNAWTRTASPA